METELTRLLATGFSLVQEQKFSSALEYFAKALDLDSSSPDATNGACLCLISQGDEQTASDLLWKCFRSGNANDDIAINLARLLIRRSDQYDIAKDILRQQIGINPGNPELFTVLAELEESTGNTDRALELLKLASASDTTNFEAPARAALLQIMKGDAESGMSSLLEATVTAPGEPKLRYYQGKALFLLNDHAQALESFLDYCEKTSENEWAEDVYSMIGLCYLMLGNLDMSILNLEKALLINPNDANTLVNAYNAYRSSGEIEKSIDCCQRAMRIQALSADSLQFKSFSNLMLLYSTMGTQGIKDARLAAKMYWHNRVKWNRLSTSHRDTSRSINSRVKIGIISSEIGDHVVSLFLEPLLRHYPQDLIELELVLTSCRYESSTDRLLSLPEKVHNLSTANQDYARQQLLEQNYDIIIETTGYTSNSSLEILSQRCAPIQCHYIGYHSSTFAPNLDWFVGDSELVPAYIEPQFSEKILRVDGPWISRYIPGNLPIAQCEGIGERFVMGSTNQSSKLTLQTFAYWAEALHEVQDSILIVKDRFALSSRVQQRLIAFMEERMIARDRLVFIGGTPDWQKHMNFYNSVDVILDATPWSASTTAFDTLLMGAPFVAIRGSVAAARMSSSILKAASLDEFVADDMVSFREIVKDLSLHRELHRQQRQLYQERNLCSGAFDPEGVAGKVFRALLELV